MTVNGGGLIYQIKADEIPLKIIIALYEWLLKLKIFSNSVPARIPAYIFAM